jgi:hypothetical protein
MADSSYDEAAAQAVETSTDGTAGSQDSGTLDQQATPGTDASDQSGSPWDGKQFSIKFRDKEVVPQSREQLMTYAQQGYGYSQRMAELKAREEELNQLDSSLGQYKKLADAFDSNPQFKQQILELYQKTMSGVQAAQASGDQQAVADNTAILSQMQQMMAPVQQKLQQFDDFQNQIAASRADEDLAKECDSIKSKYKDHDWVSEDSEGHTLLWRILNTANDKGLLNIEDAYRLYMFDNVAEKSRADALRDQAKRIQEDRQRGVVSNGHVIPKTQSGGPDVHNMNWNQVAEAAIADMR